MANTTPTADPGQKAQKGILISGILLLILIFFGSGRQLISQGFASTTAGNTVETQLIDLKGRPSPSIEIVNQLQYTQQALFKAELLTENGDVISQASQDFNSNRSESSKRLNISDWPDPQKVKVRLSVASQSISSAPPAGVTATEIPVIFEVNAYSQRFNSGFLWPGFWACVGLWIIVKMARNKANSWE
ncbi:MAG: hypothetical protein AAFQ63_07500 [Cyanobacteria bacterium J06621_11]